MMLVTYVLDLQATKAEAVAEAAAWLERPIEVAECADPDCGEHGLGCGHPYLAHYYGDAAEADDETLGCVLCEHVPGY